MDTSAQFGGDNMTDDLIEAQISEAVASHQKSPIIDRRRTDPKKSPKAVSPVRIEEI